jgi:signal transduction histidine kinase
MEEPAPRRVQPPGAPSLAWRLGFSALLAALLAFAVWSLLLVIRVQSLRADVTRNVRWLGEIAELQHRTAERREADAASQGAWTAAADAVAAIAGQAESAGQDALAGPLAAVAAAIDAARRDAAALPGLEPRLDALIREIRRDNAARSGELGECWDDLVFVVFTALLLAALDVQLLAYAERRRRQALRLAAEIEATAEQLAETRSTLREREAVARLADELRAARDRAEEASAAKTQFMARMSHELFTPLNIITGYTALVRERCEEHALAEAAGDLDRVEQAANGLYRLVRHVLDLTELDAGRAEVELGEVALAGLVAQVVEAAKPTAARSGTQVATHVPAELTVRSDRRRLATIVGELVDNACRFTRGGHVEVRAAAGEDGVRIEVRDDGPGMRDEDLERATTPFFQVDESARRRHDGAGLGLTVAQRLTARIGGTLALRSAPGQGTTATVHLPR